MKREIKFRGKRIDNGEWIYGNVHFPNKLFTGVFICPDTTYGDVAPGLEDGDNFEEFKKHGAAIGHYHRVIPESVSEYTGLKDKNGKEIYEGDIVRLGEIRSKYDNELFEVIYDFGSFQLFKEDGLPPLSFVYMAKQLLDKGKLPTGFFSSAMQFIEVIGNVFENPELLNS